MVMLKNDFGWRYLWQFVQHPYRLPRVRRSFNFPGAVILRHACKLGLEDIASKRRDFPYRSGRCKAWVKVKNPNTRKHMTDGEIELVYRIWARMERSPSSYEVLTLIAAGENLHQPLSER
jgi:ATP-dependent DNA ligase